MTPASEPRLRGEDARDAVAGVRRWYHSIEVVPGVVTPGVFDLRPIVNRLPWPDVRGKRCLDVGTFDGFLAFELERRGAGEVVATDIATYEQWDWELDNREPGLEYMNAVFGPEMSQGFRTAHRLLDSSVRLEPINVYELSPRQLGRFEVVVCGSLLLHLRDPFRALTAIRSVCAGQFLCTNQIDLLRSLLRPRGPLVRLDGTSGQAQWWIPNAAAHRQMLLAAGFSVERESRLYSIPFGPAHEPRPWRPRRIAATLLRTAVTGNNGVPHLALLTRPTAL